MARTRLKIRITELFGIDRPIIQGGMPLSNRRTDRLFQYR